MMIPIRKAFIRGQMYDVYTEEELMKLNVIDPQDRLAIEKNGLLYPVVSTKGAIGARVTPMFIQYVNPEDDIIDEYVSTGKVIDFKSESMVELIEKSEMLKGIEYEILCKPDHIFSPPIKDEDTPLMKALKTAVTAKNIDIDRYQSRFGPNFNNNKRLFNGNSITINKAALICNALDMKMHLTIEDASPDVANPMNTIVEVDIVGGGDNE